jgi:hypothetical protein
MHGLFGQAIGDDSYFTVLTSETKLPDFYHKMMLVLIVVSVSKEIESTLKYCCYDHFIKYFQFELEII